MILNGLKSTILGKINDIDYKKRTTVSLLFEDSLTVSSIMHVPRPEKSCGDSNNSTVCYSPGIQITVKNQSHCTD